MLKLDDENLLKKDCIANISMLGFFSKHDPIKVLRRGDSLMAQGKSDEEWWYMSSNTSLEDFNWFIDQTGQNDRFMATVENPILDSIKKKFTCRWVLSCQRFYLPDNIALPIIEAATSPLTTADAKHIYNNSTYKTFTSEAYIEEQIMNGPGIAFRDGSVLAGWVLTHDDGALGALHVLPNYRRMGIARAIVVELARKVRESGLTPFTYVESSNNASLGLVRSLGFVPDRAVHWANLNR